MMERIQNNKSVHDESRLAREANEFGGYTPISEKVAQIPKLNARRLTVNRYDNFGEFREFCVVSRQRR